MNKTGRPGRGAKTIAVSFLSSPEDLAGGLEINMYHQLLELYFCNGTRYFTVSPPSGTDLEVWRITLTRSAGIRLVVHCNNKEVLNTLISDKTCTLGDWSTYWSKNVTMIKFATWDDSDYFRLPPGIHMKCRPTDTAN